MFEVQYREVTERLPFWSVASGSRFVCDASCGLAISSEATHTPQRTTEQMAPDCADGSGSEAP